MFEFKPPGLPPKVPSKSSVREASVAPEKDAATAPVKHGFGIDEFLEDFKFLSSLCLDLLKKAVDCKNEKTRLSCLMEWADELHAILLQNRKTPQFEGKSLDNLILIQHRLKCAFVEEVKKVAAETKVPSPKVYDFGLKNFLSYYSARIPEESKKQFEDIHLAHPMFSSEIAILEDLIGWVRGAQKEFQSDLEALKILEAIKFRLRVGLSINRALERAPRKTELFLDKECRLKEKLKAVTDGTFGLKELRNRLNDRDVDWETREHGVFMSRKEIFAKVQKLTKKEQALESMLKKNSEEIKHQDISKSLITHLEKLSESDSTVEMPIVTCETKAERGLVDKIQKYIERHNKRVDSFSSRKSPVFTSSAESETSDTPAEPAEIFEEESPDEKEKRKEELRLFRFQNERREREKFGLKSPSPLTASIKDTESDATEVEQEIVKSEIWRISTKSFESESKEVMQTIKQKKAQLLKLRNTHVEHARSAELLKTQMFRSIPEVIKSKTVKGLSDVDQRYQQYKNSENKEAVIKEVVMTWWDRVCEKLGFTLSTRHVARKAEVKKYFESLDARAQLVTGLQTGSDGKIASSFNKLNVPENYFNLWKSLCEVKHKVSEDAVAAKSCSAEIKMLEEKLKKIQAEQKRLLDEDADLNEDLENNSKTTEPTTILGFSSQ